MMVSRSQSATRRVANYKQLVAAVKTAESRLAKFPGNGSQTSQAVTQVPVISTSGDTNMRAAMPSAPALGRRPAGGQCPRCKPDRQCDRHRHRCFPGRHMPGPWGPMSGYRGGVCPWVAQTEVKLPLGARFGVPELVVTTPEGESFFLRPPPGEEEESEKEHAKESERQSEKEREKEHKKMEKEERKDDWAEARVEIVARHQVGEESGEWIEMRELKTKSLHDDLGGEHPAVGLHRSIALGSVWAGRRTNKPK